MSSFLKKNYHMDDGMTKQRYNWRKQEFLFKFKLFTHPYWQFMYNCFIYINTSLTYTRIYLKTIQWKTEGCDNLTKDGRICNIYASRCCHRRETGKHHPRHSTYTLNVSYRAWVLDRIFTFLTLQWELISMNFETTKDITCYRKL